MSTDYHGIPMPAPHPALTYEDMWNQVRDYIAGMALDRKTPQAIFNVRELMGELERERIRPFVEYVEQRREFERGKTPRTAAKRNWFGNRNAGPRLALAAGAESSDGGPLND